jgi:predicted nucleic acid-binding protein
MRVTSNTSPLICLAKIGRLKLLKDLYTKIVISQFVKMESVDKGKALGAYDALEIEKAIEEGWITVSEPTKEQDATIQRLIGDMRIGLGEAGALTLAKDENMLVILDDKEARAIAKSWDLEYTSTVMVLYEAFVRKLINYDELVEDFAKLAKVIWVSTDVTTEIINKARKVRK